MTEILYRGKYVSPNRKSSNNSWTLKELLKDPEIKGFLWGLDIKKPTKKILYDLIKEHLLYDILISPSTEIQIERFITKFGTKKKVLKLCLKYSINFKGKKLSQVRQEILKKINYNYTNEPLIECVDSWDEVSEEYHFITSGNYCFDIRSLITMISMQLNVSEYGGPRSKWPYNCYNRIPFFRHELINIANYIKKENLSINIALYYFLSNLLINQELFSDDNISIYKNNPILLVQILLNDLRFKIINQTDSQENYTGYWVKKDIPLTEFEKARNIWIQLGQQLTMVGQEQRIIMEENYPKEEFHLTKDSLVKWP
jgi:hypothetical protein